MVELSTWVFWLTRSLLTKVLKNIMAQTLITTDGTTLLGADDRQYCWSYDRYQYLTAHPEIKHCEIRVGFGLQRKKSVSVLISLMQMTLMLTLPHCWWWTSGERSTKTFSAAAAELHFQGPVSILGTAKVRWWCPSANLIDFHNQLLGMIVWAADGCKVSSSYGCVR